MNDAISTAKPSNWPVNILAAMMFLIPAVGVPNEYMLQDTLKSAIAAFGILLAGLALLVDLGRHPRSIRWHGVLIFPTLLCLYALGSMAWSHAYLAGVEAIRWFLLSLLIWVALNSLTTENTRRLLCCIHWGLFSASLWLALQFWIHFDLFPQAAAPASTFINRNFFAEYAVIALPISGYLLATARSSRWLPAFALTVALNIVAILMTGTRSALLALCGSSLLLALLLCRYSFLFTFSSWPTRLRRTVALSMLVSFFVMGLIPSVNAEIGLGRTAFDMSGARSKTIATVIQGDDSSVSTRIDMWKATARMFLDQPWMGVGAGAWEVEIPRYQRMGTYLETDYYAHNELLQLLSEYGAMVGGLSIAFFLAYLLKMALDAPGELKQFSTNQPLRSIAAVSLLSLVLVASAGFSLRLAGTSVLFALMLGLLALPRPVKVNASPTCPKRRYNLALQTAQLLVAGLIVTAVGIGIQSFRAEYHLASSVFAGNAALEARPTDPAKSANLHQAMLEHARLGIELHPHYRKITPILGPLFVGLGDWPHAIWIWESMTHSRPHVAAFWYNLTKGYLEVGDVERARVALNKLVTLQPQAPGSIALHARILEGSGHHAEAVERLQNSIDTGTFDYDVLDLAVKFASVDHNWPLARQALELQLVTRPQQQAAIHFKLGWLYFNHWSGDHHEQALHHFQAGYDAAPPAQRADYLRHLPALLQQRITTVQ